MKDWNGERNVCLGSKAVVMYFFQNLLFIQLQVYFSNWSLFFFNKNLILF